METSTDAPAHPRALWLVAPLLLATVTCRPPAPATSAVAGPEVLRTLRAGRDAHVVVALVHAAPRAGDAASAQRAIARLQAEVLAQLPPEDYRSTQLFAAVPAMAGTVLTERGLQRILAHPHVRRVDVDPGGSGSPSGSR